MPRNYAKVVYPILFLVLVVIVAWWCLWPCWFRPETTTVLLVRHAEKGSFPPSDPELTTAGEARAADLAHVARDAGVTAIFVTNTNRTQRTAQDLASLLGLTPEIPAGSLEDLAALILSDHRGETVLVVGHSNTVPGIIEALGGEAVPEITEDEFDRFFVVTIPCCGRRATVKLQYGEPSP